MDDWMIKPQQAALAHLNGRNVGEGKIYSDKYIDTSIKTHLEGIEKDLFVKGQRIYKREGFCANLPPR